MIRRRQGADYGVMVERQSEHGRDLLERLAHQGEDVSLVAADLRSPGMDGVEFHLAHAGDQFRAAEVR